MKTKRIIAAFLIVLSLIALMVPVFASAAGQVCSSVSGSGACNAKKTFTVTTNNKWLLAKKYVQISVTPGKAVYSGVSNKEYSHYGCYNVKVVDTSTGKTVSNKSYKNTDSFKITLPKRNTTYEVTITAWNSTSLHLYNTIKYGGFSRWKSAPTWTAIKDNNVTYCA